MRKVVSILERSKGLSLSKSLRQIVKDARFLPSQRASSFHFWYLTTKIYSNGNEIAVNRKSHLLLVV